MTIWKLLASRTGAISKGGVLGLAATVGFAGINFYDYLNDSSKAQEQQIATLSQIIARGEEIPAEYVSAIQVADNNGRLATAEERAAFEGSMAFDGGEGVVANINSFSAGISGGIGGVDGVSVSGTALGQGEAGLGMGGNEAKAVGGHGGTSGQVADPSAGVDKALGTKINKLGDTSAGVLPPASMARVSAGNGSSSFAGNGTGAGMRGAAQTEGQGRIGASSISGAMPGGSMLVSAQGSLRGARSASYIPGSRQTSVGTGINSREGNSLRSIAVQSGKVAANANRSSNEGDQVFMGGENLAGGVTLEDGTVNMTEGGSAGDFEDKLNNNEGNLNSAIDEIDTTEQEKKASRTALAKKLISLLFSTIAAMISISCLTKAAREGGPHAWVLWALAGVVTAIQVVNIALFIKDAVNHQNKFGDAGIAWLCYSFSALFLVGVGMSWVKGVGNWISNVVDKLYSAFGMSGGAGGGGTSAGSDMSITTGLPSSPGSLPPSSMA